MNFRNGYLGGMILVLALVAAVLASWALSLDVTEREITKYDYVTELTGLFDSEQAPSYITYIPSTNYTGYYTDPDTEYFDGVTATITAQHNSYKLNLAPLSSTEGAIDLTTDVTANTSHTMSAVYWSTNDSSVSQRVSYALLSDVLTELGYLNNQGNNWDTVTIKSDWSSWTASGSFFTFATSEMLNNPFHPLTVDYAISLKNPNLTGELTLNLAGDTIDAEKIFNPILACKYDDNLGYAYLYYDQEMRNGLGLQDIETIYIVWSSSGWLGNTGTIEAYDYPTYSYMDIRDGVRLE